MLDCHGMLVPGPSVNWGIPTAFLYDVEECGCPLFNTTVPILTLGDVSSGLDSDYANSEQECCIRNVSFIGSHLCRHICVHLFSLVMLIFINLKTRPNTLQCSLIHSLYSYFFFFCLATNQFSVGGTLRVYKCPALFQNFSLEIMDDPCLSQSLL